MSATLLTGPARRGKTARLLDEYAAALKEATAQRQPGSTLWIAPNRFAVRSVLDGLMRAADSVVFAPNVMTFAQFAEHVLQAWDQPVAPLSPAGPRRILRRIIDRLADRGELTYFSSIASTSGFLDLVSSFIAELKRDECWPGDFATASERLGASSKDRELAAIYAAYQDHLNRFQLYDAEGRFWSARDALNHGCRGPFESLSLTVLDGFTDFTHTQHEILRHLAEMSERLLISLPLENGRRADLFSRPSATVERVRESLAMDVDAVSWKAAPAQSPAEGSFRVIADDLFVNPRELTPQPAAAGVEVLAGSGPRAEIDAVTARAKRLLLSGVSADDIAVCVRDLDDYGERLTHAFAAAGIPAWCSAGRAFAGAPMLRYLALVLKLERDDWQYADLLGVVHSSWFRLPSVKLKRRDLRAVGEFLRHRKLHAGRKDILRTLQRDVDYAAKTVEDKATPKARRAEELAAATTVLSRLDTALARLRQPATLADWAQRVQALAKDIGPQVRPRKRDDADVLADREERTWERFEGILFDAVQVDERFDDERKLTLAEFCDLLHDLLHTQEEPPPGDGAGCVKIVDAEEIRGMDVGHLFVAGLTETAFPRQRRDDCLYGESERRELNEHGLNLGHSTVRSQDEMLLFYSVVTRPGRQLTLSFSETAGDGQQLYPSPYLAALRDLFDENALPIASAGRLDPVPDDHAVVTPADWRAAGTANALSGRPELLRALAETERGLEQVMNLCAAVEVAQHRFRSRGWSRFEGLVQHPEHLAELQQRFPADYQFSTTQLERYALCGFRFAMESVLKLKRPEIPAVATDFRERGNLMHDVWTSLHRELLDTPDRVCGVRERLVELTEEQIARRPGDSELAAALNRIEAAMLGDWAEAYELQLAEYEEKIGEKWDQPPRAAFLEQPFGRVPDREYDEADESIPPATFGAGDRETLVHGRVDRVDVGSIDGRDVYTVLDYKTGGTKRFNVADVESGRSLQLVLYALALKRIGLVSAGAECFQLGYWRPHDAGLEPGFKGYGSKAYYEMDQAVLASLESMLDDLIPRFAADIRAGRFAVDSNQDHCTNWCQYKTICRIAQIRPLKERLDKQ